jgi:hypothetical protein
MKRVTGIGGIFFKSENREALFRGYETHLGIEGDPVDPVEGAIEENPFVQGWWRLPASTGWSSAGWATGWSPVDQA